MDKRRLKRITDNHIFKMNIPNPGLNVKCYVCKCDLSNSKIVAVIQHKEHAYIRYACEKCNYIFKKV